MSAPNSQTVEALWDAYNFLKEIQETTGDQHWGASPLIERMRLAAVAAQSNGPDSGVPREPTAAMTFAGLAAHPDLGVTGIWQAMYDAAPSEAGADDTKRMDWLDKKDGTISHLGYGEYRYYFGPGHGTARTRIDAAMEQERRSATDRREG